MRKVLAFSRVLYLSLTAISFYLLFASRSGEVYTVWQFMNPMFMPTFFITTILLVAIIFSSERIDYKLFFIIIYSILVHSFFVIIFPAGDISFQQLVLGLTRRIFNNLSPHGWGSTAENPLTRIFNWFDEPNFLSVYSIMFARMFYVDVFWTHLPLIPVLWGIFVPTITFMITKTLGGDEKISALASLLSSAFPLLIYWGAISVSNSLGFIFFLGSVYFFLKYLTSPEPKYTFLMLIFTFASFISHFLTGAISVSFLLIAYSLRKYEREKKESPTFAKLFLLIIFILATSILPFALVYLRIFGTSSPTYFSLNKIYGYTTTEFVANFLLGAYLNYDLQTTLMLIVGPLIAFIWVVYKLYTTRNQKLSNKRIYMVFFLLGFIMLWIDYRILKIFMMQVPFNEERVWVFRDLISVPLVALAISDVIVFLRRKTSQIASFKLHLPFPTTSSTNVKRLLKAISYSALGLLFIINILMPAILASWITLSINSEPAYSHGYIVMQTTSYELDAVKYIEKNTNKSYVVICDFWISYAGQMIVGSYNPKAYYFQDTDPVGLALFIKMTNNASREVMIEAMNYTKTTVAYFIISKAREGTNEYNNTIQEAEQNSLPLYKVFFYNGEEKLRIYNYSLSGNG